MAILYKELRLRGRNGCVVAHANISILPLVTGTPYCRVDYCSSMFMNGAEYSMLCSPRPIVPIPDYLGEEVDGCLAITPVTRLYKHDN